MRLREILPSECSILISEQRVARLGRCPDNQPYVVPIYMSNLFVPIDEKACQQVDLLLLLFNKGF